MVGVHDGTPCPVLNHDIPACKRRLALNNTRISGKGRFSDFNPMLTQGPCVSNGPSGFVPPSNISRAKGHVFGSKILDRAVIAFFLSLCHF